MPNLTTEIEKYIKGLIKESQGKYIKIKRNEMAVFLRCAPSQINYVLSTRFSPERGYKVESQRGGGGYIRISKVSPKAAELLVHLEKFLEEGITHNQCKDLVISFQENGIFTNREGKILIEITNANVLALPLPLRDQVRANIVRVALINILECNGGE